MRCAISSASATISCMVRLACRLPNTVVGSATPTAAQTSRTTVNRVMSRRLVRPRVERHAHQRLAVQAADRRLAGLGGDELADLVEVHVLELALAAGPLQRLVVLRERHVLGAQRLQLGLQLGSRRVLPGRGEILVGAVLLVAPVRAEIFQLLTIDRGELLDRVDVLPAQAGALAFGEEGGEVERRAALGLLRLRLKLAVLVLETLRIGDRG